MKKERPTALVNLTKGIIKENPVLIFMLGICPALAVSTQALDAIGMGIATTFVLLGSNTAISLFRKIIPNKVRIPCYIVFISGFVTLAQMTLHAFAYPLYQSLGIFLPLIAVNCVIFARADIYAKSNTVLNSITDALGMGAGFTLALFLIASIREIIGSGKWFGIELPVLAENNVSILTMAPGGFIVFGCLVAVVNKILRAKGKAVKKEFGCASCPSSSICGKSKGGVE